VPNFPEVFTLGEAMALIVPERKARLSEALRFRIQTAGAESNVALHLSDLGHRVAWVGRLGQDPLGDRVSRALENGGVDLRWSRRDIEAPTAVFFKDPGPVSTEVYYYRAGSAGSRIQVEDVSTLPFQGARLAHVSGVTLALGSGARAAASAFLDLAPRAGLTTSFDVNYRRKLWSSADAAPALADAARQADLVFVGLDESEALWGTRTPEEVRTLIGERSELIVKDEGRPVAVFAPGSDRATRIAVEPVEVREPVGAGDAFAAGYLSGFLRGDDLTKRVGLGHSLATRALTTLSDHEEVLRD
jgi:2-dehydro-3-deoxygluconokinase